MDTLNHLLEKNKQWAESMKQENPDFFQKLSRLQTPDYLWIGCADSRIPPNTSIGLLPGEIFVHRNIANLVIHTDMNCLSVMQYAIEALDIKHIIICGHYGCGGVKAALENSRLGLIDNWLRHIQEVCRTYETPLKKIDNWDERFDRVCELNVMEQVMNVGQTTILQDAWLKKKNVSVYGWIYHITDGIFQDLRVTISNMQELEVLREHMLEIQRGHEDLPVI